MACDMPEPCKFLSLDSCQKRFLWTNKKYDLGPHPVVGLVFHAGDAEKSVQALGFESLDPFFRVSKQCPCFTAIEEDGGDKRLAKLMVLHRQSLFSVIIAEAILMRTFAE